MSGRKIGFYMPHAAHFRGAEQCRFHLATFVGDENGSGFIVSSVGDWFPDSRRREIGFRRFYETFIFDALRTDTCAACRYEVCSGLELDGSRGFLTGGECAAYHHAKVIELLGGEP